MSRRDGTAPTARRRKANRANARLSTGPKTSKGRNRSARNALRHGLSLPIFSDPALSQEAATLARQIAPAKAKPQIQELARAVAEAHIDVRRIRAARHDFIARALRDPNYDSCADSDKKLMAALRIIGRYARFEDIPAEEVNLLDSKLVGPEKFGTILAEIALRLPAFDRYEARALSRRKRAIQALDAALVEAARLEAAERDSLRDAGIEVIDAETVVISGKTYQRLV
jgi:hypothetical protein